MSIVNQIFYAGIGSRGTPLGVLQLMRELAVRLAQLGLTLRSGAAEGADLAFESGCEFVGGSAEICLPWLGFNGHEPTKLLPGDAHFRQAAEVHPYWSRLSDGAKALHARNTIQVLGLGLNQPVSFVLCWTADGCESERERTPDTGGTGTAIVLADRRGIPVFNLANADALPRLQAHVAKLRRYHPDGQRPAADDVFVFGSNLAGRHGAGAAKFALTACGAVLGKGEGPQGSSYAIATKNGLNGQSLSDPSATLSLEKIKAGVDRFIEYARSRPEQGFLVTRVGCGLAAFEDEQIAPLFSGAPLNCSFADQWSPWVAPVLEFARPSSTQVARGVADGINIWSGAKGLGGALTNMSERAREKGCIKHSYPVAINGVVYPDSEAAYQAAKRPGDIAYNNSLMVDIIAQKFKQNPKLFNYVQANGGSTWICKCSHFTGATSERFQAWEGAGLESRFIRNLLAGYEKALLGRAERTRVVHVKEAPFDVYIGRANADLPESVWHNPYVIGKDGTREDVVGAYHRYVLSKPDLLKRVAGLQGLTLGCWCKSKQSPDALCHGDVLVALAEGHEWVQPNPAQASLF